MITLITGVPGAGKTLWAVSQLRDKIKGDYANRKVFAHGINELKIETTSIPDGQTIHTMHEWLKWPEYQGSVVIIDESQHIFPPRSSNSKAPELVEWLHVHRHFGIDLILITQMPQRIDKQVRDLVGAHYHIHMNKLGFRVRYFWDYCANNPKSESRDAQKFIHKLDKSAQDLYKSASVHTKADKPKSKLVYIVPMAILAVPILGYNAYKTLGGNDVEQTAKTAASSGHDVATSMAADAISTTQKGREALKPEMFVPTIPDRVESKPIYDAVRQVRTFEYPVACISGGASGCTCYTHQATAIKEIDKKTCETYVKDGLPFNPYKEPRQNAQNTPSESVVRGSPSPVGEVLVMGGKPQQNLMYDGYIEAGEQFR